jgi:hypothetical protein
MKDFLKKNTLTLTIVLATIILAGIAIFTAIKLYQLRQESVAPNAPESNPAAATTAPIVTCQTLTFSISTPTPSPSGSASPTPTPTVTASPTPAPQCGTTCGTNSDCPSTMVCYVGVCRNPSCTTSSSCVCQTATPTPTATATPVITASPTPAPTSTPIAQSTATPEPLPVTGIETPTILGITAGAVLLILGLAFVL